ncbi:MAG TPA: FAD-dependent monooxygenase [Acidimicrobiia bacterium]|nr:FAD-dependent monooxygenase [Acidimicrobiia bacterium]
MEDVADVVVVGGGIGGASLACALAREGLGVVVLEATTEYEDRVRGESMQAWGVKEARDLGVEDAMLAAGAHVAPLWKQYSESAGAADIPAGMMVEGIPGTLNLRHPVACQALIDAATDSGATVVRGARDVKLTNGGSPTVSYLAHGTSHELRTSLVVGAEGRASTVRKQAGITLERQPAISYIAGLLVEGLDDVPDDHDVLADAGDLFFVMFHQGGGRARVYLIPGESGRRRFSGRAGTESFLASCRQAEASYPWAEQVAAGTPAGPCATYPGDDTWTPTPFADGVVLIGDAAGHNDPIIGQGLSIAARDARIVRDLVLDGARDATAFVPYGEERSGRMERLRFIADVLAVTQAEDADNTAARRALVAGKMAAMEPEIFGLLAGAFAGPEVVPDELVDPALLDRIRAA